MQTTLQPTSTQLVIFKLSLVAVNCLVCAGVLLLFFILIFFQFFIPWTFVGE